MSPIELVCALLSFVYALAITHLLQGASELWVARDRLRFSVSLAAWMVLAVLMVVCNWLALIPLAQGQWSQIVVMTSFCTAVIQYFTCSLAAMKVPEEGRVDMRAYEDRNGVGYKAAYLALTGIVLIANALQFEDWAGKPFEWGLFVESSWPIVAYAGAIVVSLWWRARWVQIAVPVSYCAYMLWVLIVTG